MDDYISRADATQAKPEFLNESHVVSENALYAKGWNACNLAYTENLRAIPAADVRPVVHGEWIEENRRPRSSQFCCSVCHRTAYDPQPTRIKDWTKRCRYAFCPNCGADMRPREVEE